MDISNEEVSFSFFPKGSFVEKQTTEYDMPFYSPEGHHEYDKTLPLDNGVRRQLYTANKKSYLKFVDVYETSSGDSNLESYFANENAVFNTQENIKKLPVIPAAEFLPTVSQKRHQKHMKIKEEVYSPYTRHTVNQITSSFHGAEFCERFVNVNHDHYERLVNWAHRVNLQDKLRKQTIPFVQANDLLPVYIFKLEVDIQQLIDYNAYLGNFLMTDGQTFTHLLKKVCFDLLQSEAIAILHSMDEIIVKPTFTNFPVTYENIVQCSRDVLKMKKQHGRLFKVRGLVVGMSSVLPHTRCAKYLCPTKHCIWSENYYSITTSLGLSEADVVRNDFQCDNCGSYFNEDISKRILGECRYYSVVTKDATKNLQAVNFSNTHCAKSIQMMLQDDLLDDVFIGGCYWFTGIVKHDDNLTVFQVVTVERDIPLINNLKHFAKLLPDSLCTLYEDRKESPWSFVSSLTYCFLGDIVPCGIYHLYKTMLLMSLVMEGDTSLLNNEEHTTSSTNQLNILIEDHEVLLCQKMMYGAACFSEFSIVHRTGMQLFGSVSDHTNRVFVDGGCLPISSNSLCVIPNLLSLKKPILDKLQKSFEDGTVAVDIPSKQHEELQRRQFFLPFKGTVWSCFELEKSPIEKHDISKDTSSISSALSSQFHLHVSRRNSKRLEFDMDEVLASHAIQYSLTNHLKEGFIPVDDMKEFVSRVKSDQVDMSVEAYKLLKTFYAVSRRVNMNFISHNALKTMFSLAAAHAKVMLHKKVSINDAVAAVYIFEQLMALRFGDSIVGVIPVVSFDRKDMSRYVGAENDVRMYQLKYHLLQYCSTYYPQALDLRNSEE